MMRFIARLVGLSALMAVWPAADVPGQEWSVELYDVNAAAAHVSRDQIEAESLEFTPDGKFLVTAGFAYTAATNSTVGEVVLRNVRDGSIAARLRAGAASYALRSGSLAVNRSGRLAAALGRDGRQPTQWFVDLFDLRARKYVGRIGAGKTVIQCVAFSPDEKVLAVAKWDGTLELWNPETRTLSHKLLANGQGIGAVAFSPDGKLLAAERPAGGIALWNADNLRGLASIPPQPKLTMLGALVFSHNGRLLAAGGYPSARDENSPIYVWEIAGGAENADAVETAPYGELLGHRQHTYALAFSPDDTLLASASQDQTVRIWDPHVNHDLAPISVHQDFVYDVAFSPDGKQLATLGRDSLKLWSVEKLRRGPSPQNRR
jgi:WD40 repeat protein